MLDKVRNFFFFLIFFLFYIKSFRPVDPEHHQYIIQAPLNESSIYETKKKKKNWKEKEKKFGLFPTTLLKNTKTS